VGGDAVGHGSGGVNNGGRYAQRQGPNYPPLDNPLEVGGDAVGHGSGRVNNGGRYDQRQGPNYPLLDNPLGVKAQWAPGPEKSHDRALATIPVPYIYSKTLYPTLHPRIFINKSLPDPPHLTDNIFFSLFTMSSAEHANSALNLVADKIVRLTSRAQQLKESDPSGMRVAHEIAVTLVSPHFFTF
jgi:hypothetical protein